MYYITVTYFSSKAGIAEGFSCFNWPKIYDMFNLLTAGPEYIQFLIFLLPLQVPPFKHVRNKM